MEIAGREELLDAIYPAGDGAELLIAVAPGDYSASRIARAVEDCDRHLLNLNVMSGRTAETERLLVAVRIDSHGGLPAVERSIERYGYDVIATSAADVEPDDEGRRRVEELLHLLEI